MTAYEKLEEVIALLQQVIKGDVSLGSNMRWDIDFNHGYITHEITLKIIEMQK